MKRYLHLTKNTYMVGLVWRFNAIFTVLSNLFYIVVIYFLWKNIYGSQATLREMTFPQTFIYLALTSSLFVVFKTFVDWQISRDIISGVITMDLIKPLDYQVSVLFRSAGFMLVQLTLIALPTLVILLVVFHAQMPIGINLLFFAISLVLAYLLSFMIDYMVGLTSFYTQSLWGISTAKEIIVLVLSGALIPIRFFPDALRNVLVYLPFQAIYNAPISILTDPILRTPDYLNMLGIQLLWVIAILVISRLFYAQAIKVLTIAGG